MYKILYVLLLAAVCHSYSAEHSDAPIPLEVRAYILKHTCLQELSRCSTVKKKKDISRIVDNTLRALRCQPTKQDIRDLLMAMMTMLPWPAQKKLMFLSNECNQKYGRDYHYSYQELFPCTFTQWWSSADEKSRYRVLYRTETDLLITIPAEITSFQGINTLLGARNDPIYNWRINNECLRIIEANDFAHIKNVYKLTMQRPLRQIRKNAFKNSDIGEIHLHFYEDAHVEHGAFKQAKQSQSRYHRFIGLTIHGKDRETMQKKWSDICFYNATILHISYCTDNV